MRTRIVALDVLRGVALCGVLVANVEPIAAAGRPPLEGVPPDGWEWLGLVVHTRFMPVFALLFGVGFALVHESTRDRLPLARRLSALLLLGAAHFLLLWRGDILFTYALAGLLVLLPASWLPPRVTAVLGAAVVVTAVALGDNRFVLIPGLFLVGAAAVRLGVVDRLEQSARVPLLIGVMAASAALPAATWQIESGGDGRAVVAAGLLTATAHVCAILLALRTPLRAPLAAVFAPMGRMALTNYLSATVLVLCVTTLLGEGHPGTWPTPLELAVAGGVLSVQCAWSALWLRHFTQGPLEWLWRWATHLERPAFRRREPAPA